MRFTAPKNRRRSQYAPPTVIDAEEIQRRRAFLDADNSMQGLRNVEADQGLFAGVSTSRQPERWQRRSKRLHRDQQEATRRHYAWWRGC